MRFVCTQLCKCANVTRIWISIQRDANNKHEKNAGIFKKARMLTKKGTHAAGGDVEIGR